MHFDPFTEAERTLLVEIIDFHVQGVVDSKDYVIIDPTVESAEQLLDLVSGMDEDLATLNEIRKKLTNEF